MNVIVVLLMLFFDIFSSSGPAPAGDAVDAGAGAGLVTATIRPGGGDQARDYLRCRWSEDIPEEPCV